MIERSGNVGDGGDRGLEDLITIVVNRDDSVLVGSGLLHLHPRSAINVRYAKAIEQRVKINHIDSRRVEALNEISSIEEPTTALMH